MQWDRGAWSRGTECYPQWLANSWWNSRPNQNYKSAHILVNLAIVRTVKGLTFCRSKSGVSMQKIIWNGHSNVKTCRLPNVHPGFSVLDVPSDSKEKIFNKCTKSYGRQFFLTSHSHLMWSIGVCCVCKLTLSCFQH